MEKRDYHRTLGISVTATAAEIEASYLSLAQFLDPNSVPPSLRSWAIAQTALLDEAYAALTESDEEETAPDDVADSAGQKTASTRAIGAVVTRRPTASPAKQTGRSSDEYDEDDDDYEDSYEDEESPDANRGTKVKVAGKPTWQQQGRRRPRDVARHNAPRRSGGKGRPRQYQGSSGRFGKTAIGLGIGLVVVIALFVTYQYQMWPFAANSSDQTADKPIPIDQARYSQLQALAQRDPQNFATVFELGQMTFEAQRYAESIGWLEKALTIKPDDVFSLQDVGTANFNLGNLDKARDMWLVALKVDPNNAQTHWNLGFYYASKQPADIDSAIQEWQQVIQFSSPNDQLYKLAQTHLSQYLNRDGSATPVSKP